MAGYLDMMEILCTFEHIAFFQFTCCCSSRSRLHARCGRHTWIVGLRDPRSVIGNGRSASGRSGVVVVAAHQVLAIGPTWRLASGRCWRARMRSACDRRSGAGTGWVQTLITVDAGGVCRPRTDSPTRSACSCASRMRHTVLVHGVLDVQVGGAPSAAVRRSAIGASRSVAGFDDQRTRARRRPR